jgi:hypothetical protein
MYMASKCTFQLYTVVSQISRKGMIQRFGAGLRTTFQEKELPLNRKLVRRTLPDLATTIVGHVEWTPFIIGH